MLRDSKAAFYAKVDRDLCACGLIGEEDPERGCNSIRGVSSDETKRDRVREPTGWIEPSWTNRLLCAVAHGRGACLFGPRGAGKDVGLRGIAATLNINVVTLQCSRGMSFEEMRGCWEIRGGNSVFVPGPLARALEEDAWLVAEEANVVDPGVWSIVNTICDDCGEPLLLPDGRRISVGPRFALFLLFNEGSAYAGTCAVNAALRDRLMPIYVDYLPREMEARILRDQAKASGDDVARVLDVAANIRAASGEQGFDFDLSPRALKRWLRLRQFGIGWMKSFEYAILDLAGAPSVAKPLRDVLLEIALATGLGSWDTGQHQSKGA